MRNSTSTSKYNTIINLSIIIKKMKKMKTLRSIMPALLAMALTVLSSCSKNSDLLESIPDDVNMAMTLNLQRALDRTSITLDETGIALPGDLGAYSREIPADVQTTIVDIHKSIDLSCLIFFNYIKMTAAPEFYMAAHLTDESLLIKTLTKTLGLKESTVDGFKVVSGGKGYQDMVFVINEGNVWLIPGQSSENAVKNLRMTLEKAKKASIMDKKEVGELLGSDHICNYAMNIDSSLQLISQMARMLPNPAVAVSVSAGLDKLKGCWSLVSYDIEGTEIEMDGKMIKSDGSAFAYPFMKQIDTAALAYIPSDCFGVTAFGINGSQTQETFNAIDEMIKSLVTDKEQQMALTASGWLRNIDGTIAFGVGADNMADLFYGGDIEKLKMTLAIQMKPGKAAEALSQMTAIINALIGNLPGIEPMKQTGNEAVMKIPQTQMALYVKAVGNDLVISNRPVTTGNASPFIAKLKGHESGLALSVKAADLTSGSCKYGIDLFGETDKNEFESSLKLTDCPTDIINGYYTLGLSIFQSYQAYSMQHRSNQPEADEIDIEEIGTPQTF